ncbi:hypothetical protein [Fontibacter flavus]|uniref:Uncharacterized protein n=1 Tax=Fontibacter flavus TaxID=654838 RepID=A0ABV6FT00_9BACT
MKLILTDYIASLKEEKELDSLMEELLREKGFEVTFPPKKGVRQYGVDIYAVGKDPEDNKKKVFLITVKQGNLDRKNWHGTEQSLEPSLREIVSVFVKNNIPKAHSSLPVKIIIAHNGINDPAIQQNWAGFTKEYPNFEFEIWQLETIVNMVFSSLISERLFSDEARVLLRKTIINIYNPEYDLSDYVRLIDSLIDKIKYQKKKNTRIKNLKKIKLVLGIIFSYCKKENDSRLAIKASEITILRVWKYLTDKKIPFKDEQSLLFIDLLTFKLQVNEYYLSKIIPVCQIKDGFYRHSIDPVTYNLIVYEHLGILALIGLESFLLYEIFKEKNEQLARLLSIRVSQCITGVIEIFNNNKIAYNPRLDDQIIEINLTFLLLHKSDRIEAIEALLVGLIKGILDGKRLMNIAPLFSNNHEELIELEVNYSKRAEYDYKSSSLLTCLAEWTVILDNSKLYNTIRFVIEKEFAGVELTLWFPESDTESFFLTQCALPDSGYCLTGIKLPESFEDFKRIVFSEYLNNCPEQGFAFFRTGVWSIGLLASRHYRTYVFPSYWRQLIQNKSELKYD